MDQNGKFEAFVRENRGRLTPQRQKIVREFLSLQGHYGVQDLYDLLRKKGIQINPSTIFRTMKLLVQAGLAVERQFGNGSAIYEINASHHDHMICLSCKRIYEFESHELEKVQNRIVRREGFLMSYHKHEIYGYCRNCRRKTREGNK